MIGDSAAVLRRTIFLLAASAVLLGGGAPAKAATAAEAAEFCVERPGWMPRPLCITEGNYVGDVCRAISQLATDYRLPEAYFARLIWQESRFDFLAISPAGAQGIAQFMPGTARLRAVRNAFDPAEALYRSAEYLRFLTDKFGNLGLAAAAYNGGEGKVSRYLANTGGLAGETRDYVRIVTGVPVEQWTLPALPDVDFTIEADRPFAESCVRMAEAISPPRFDIDPGVWQPFGVIIAQDYSAEKARSIFARVKERYAAVLGGEEVLLLTVINKSFGTRPRFTAMVGRETREAAIALCGKLTAAGGVCRVQAN